MTDDGGFHKALRTLLMVGFLVVVATVMLVMASGRDPAALASGGGFRLPWIETGAPTT